MTTARLVLAWLKKWGVWLLTGILSVLLMVVWLVLRAAKRREAEMKAKQELAKWKVAASVQYGQALRNALQSEIETLDRTDKALTGQISELPKPPPPIDADKLSAEQVAEELRGRGY